MHKKHVSWVKSVMLTLAVSEAVLLLVAFQFIPYGRAHNNPPVIAEPKWDSPKTRELFFRACGDCHSNKTAWPWYSYIAPISWLVQYYVDAGRAPFNASEWGRGESKGDDAVETVQKGSMPPLVYTIMRPSARLSLSEKQTFSQGLVATFGSERESKHEGK
jgi:hypothetical protein